MKYDFVKMLPSKYHHGLNFEASAARVDVYYRGEWLIRVLNDEEHYNQVIQKLDQFSKNYVLHSKSQFNQWLKNLRNFV